MGHLRQQQERKHIHSNTARIVVALIQRYSQFRSIIVLRVIITAYRKNTHLRLGQIQR